MWPMQQRWVSSTSTPKAFQSEQRQVQVSSSYVFFEEPLTVRRIRGWLLHNVLVYLCCLNRLLILQRSVLPSHCSQLQQQAQISRQLSGSCQHLHDITDRMGLYIIVFVRSLNKPMFHPLMTRPVIKFIWSCCSNIIWPCGCVSTIQRFQYLNE